jgi:hypothetical protein
MIKNILFFSFICLSTLSLAQQKPKSKTNVPIIEDKPKTNVPVLNDADFDLLPITSNEPNQNDLLDVVSSLNNVTTTTPNSGTNVYDKFGLQSTFTFNKKVGFMVASSEGDMVGHIFLNTKNGYSLLPHEALSEMVESDGEMNQIMSPFTEFFQYIKSSEGNFVMKMSNNESSESNHDWISKESSKKFFSTFKKTGNIVKLGGQKQFKSVEYVGNDDEGKTMYVYLAAAPDIRIDTRKTYSLTGHWGLGYIASPSRRTYLITGIKGGGTGIFMTYIENTSHTFAGKNYKPMGDIVGTAIQNKMPEIEKSMAEGIAEAIAEANAEEDPKLRQLMLEQIKQMEKLNSKTQSKAEKFAQSSDIKDLPYVSDVHAPKATADFYDMQIILHEQTIREVELSLAEAQKSNDNKKINRYTCTKSCYMRELNRLQKVKTEHIQILNQYKDDDDLRDEKISQLMETQGTPNPCDCE